MTMIMVAGCGYWRGMRLCRLWRHLRPKRHRGGKASDEKHGSIASFVAGKSSGMPRDFSHRRPCLTLLERSAPLPCDIEFGEFQIAETNHPGQAHRVEKA
jgi:hypothetical protein